MTTKSCRYIHGSVYFGPDELRHCCKRFFVDGEMRGDVPIFPITQSDDFDAEKIRQAKQSLYHAINKGEQTPCSGCPFIVEDDWSNLDKLNVDYISIEAHSVCNMRCSYCSETYYGGLKPNYNVIESFDKLVAAGAINAPIEMAFGGGEPTLLEGFEEILTHFMDVANPRHVKLFTNATQFSPAIAKYLKTHNLFVTTSIDAGTQAVFKKVRKSGRFYEVLDNLKRYWAEAKRGVTVKYIFVDDNSSLEEISAFVEQMQAYNLQDVDFQISSDFKSENLSREQAISVIRLYEMLNVLGKGDVFLDDHLRPRINAVISAMMTDKDVRLDNGIQLFESISRYKDSSVIVWGTGEYARALTKNSLFFNQVDIDFFVDSSQARWGQKMRGKDIRNINAILDSDKPIVIGSSTFHQEIINQIIGLGVSRERIIDALII